MDTSQRNQIIFSIRLLIERGVEDSEILGRSRAYLDQRGWPYTDDELYGILIEADYGVARDMPDVYLAHHAHLPTYQHLPALPGTYRWTVEHEGETAARADANAATAPAAPAAPPAMPQSGNGHDPAEEPLPIHIQQILDGPTAQQLATTPFQQSRWRSGRDTRFYTDQDVAAEVYAQYGEHLRFCITLDKPWLEWSRTRWIPREPGMVFRLIGQIINRRLAELPLNNQSEADKNERARLMKMLTEGKMMSISKFVAKDSDIETDIAAIDSDITLLNTRNCTIDLTTMEPHEHRPAENITKQADVAYNPRARAPRWQRYLEEILPDPEVRLYLQRCLGSALSGEQLDNVVHFLYGPGANGKSVMLGVIETILADYAGVVPASIFLDQMGGGNKEFIIAKMKGRRFIACEEFPEDKKLDEPLIKALTGGSKRQACFKFKTHFEYDPSDHIFVATNRMPIVTLVDLALERRLSIIPFTVIIPSERRDRTLKQQLLDEREGILNWLLEGHVMYRTMGLQPPAACRLAVETYKREMDVLGPFFEECCDIGPALDVHATLLWLAYRQWAKGQKIPESTMFNQTKFGRIMRAHREFDKRPDSGGYQRYHGLGLKPGAIYQDDPEIRAFMEKTGLFNRPF